jgi:putative endopeptidase
MQLKLTLLLAIVIMASASFGQEVNSGSMAHHKSLLNRNNMDTTVRPGDDFYRYANGNLLKNNPVHNFGTTRSSFSELQGNNNKKLHDLLDSVAAINNAPPGSSIQKLGDLYRSGMDTDAIEKAGNGPLKDRLDRIDSIKDVDGLLAEIALEHTEGLGTVFTFNVYPDEHNVGKEMCYFVPGGLGMPRECYHDEDSRPAKIREAYKAYVRQILSLIGDKNVKDDA